MPHRPVLVAESLTYLRLTPGQTVVDGTLGSAGHALEIAKVIGPGGRLIGLDQDPAAVRRSAERLKDYPGVSLHVENFRNLETVLDELNIPAVDAVILDVGISTDQLEDGARGFSFDRDGPLDMRMDPGARICARDLVNDLSQEELERLFWEYGNERWARKFARAICDARRCESIETTSALTGILEQTVPGRFRYPKGRRPGWMRRHPATRVFQALRIATNNELAVLEEGLTAIWKRINPGGHFVVIAFHSLEDRIVKRMFRTWCFSKQASCLTKKPVTASAVERIANPSSRSAKLRAVEKNP